MLVRLAHGGGSSDGARCPLGVLCAALPVVLDGREDVDLGGVGGVRGAGTRVEAAVVGQSGCGGRAGRAGDSRLG